MRETSAVRFGGREVGGRFLFELSGRALAADFVNTLDERPSGGLERLSDYGRLVDWSVQAGALAIPEAEELEATARLQPVQADEIVVEARKFRETVFRLFQAVVHRLEPAQQDVDDLQGWATEIDQGRRLVPIAGGLAWREEPRTGYLAAPLLSVAKSAIDVVTDEVKRRRLRLCASEACDWCFLDMSRAGTRRWCDMTVCGNRAKAKRHYRKRISSAR